MEEQAKYKYWEFLPHLFTTRHGDVVRCQVVLCVRLDKTASVLVMKHNSQAQLSLFSLLPAIINDIYQGLLEAGDVNDVESVDWLFVDDIVFRRTPLMRIKACMNERIGHVASLQVRPEGWSAAQELVELCEC